MPVGPFGAGGVDWSFECVGHPAVNDTAIEITDWGGTTVVVGVPSPDARASDARSRISRKSIAASSGSRAVACGRSTTSR